MRRLIKEHREENSERAARGAQVLEYYARIPGIDPDELLTDLLADLMHACLTRGVSGAERPLGEVIFEAALATAKMHYEAELEDAKA